MSLSIISFLKKEVKRGELSFNSTKTSRLIFFIVFILLWFFKPYDLDKLFFKTQLLLIFGFSICASLGYSIGKSICKPHRIQKWLNYHELIFIIVSLFLIWQLAYCYFIICIEYLFSTYIDSSISIAMPENFYYKIGLFTMQIGALVATTLVMYNKLFFYEKKYSQIIKSKTNIITEKTNKLFSIIGKNKNEHLTLDLDQFICAKSDDHYIKVYYLCSKSKQLKSSILRNTMKALELQSIDFPNIYRCHKSYIVNLLLLKSVIGNSSKAHAYISSYPEKIPISKQKITYLKKFLAELKKEVS